MERDARRRLARRARALVALLLLGQGLLVVLRVLDHEAPYAVGGLLLLVGAVLLLAGRDARPPRAREPDVRRAWLVAALGALAAGGVVAYDLRARNGWALPELAILGYGLALVAAAPHLRRRVGRADIATLVAYSFPLLLAPLAMYALNAALTAGFGSSPLSWYIRHLLVAPMAGILSWTGIDVGVVGDTVRLATSRGALFLTVGVVCAGLYATAIFLGVFALFAWEQRPGPRRLALYLIVGLAGLHAANVLRLVLLALVGYRWGGDALQAFHHHAGWVLFLLWAIAFWWLVLRRLEPGTGQSRMI